jgi:hypothetical protein
MGRMGIGRRWDDVRYRKMTLAVIGGTILLIGFKFVNEAVFFEKLRMY